MADRKTELAPTARVTLNLPAPMYRDVERWAIEAAEALAVPRVSVQDALRAMISVCLTGPNATAQAHASLRQRSR